MGLPPSFLLIESSTLGRQGLIANGSLGFMKVRMPPFLFDLEADTSTKTNEKGIRAH
jgi:hypothetical protein